MHTGGRIRRVEAMRVYRNVPRCFDTTSQRKAAVLVPILLVFVLMPSSSVGQNARNQNDFQPVTTSAQEAFRLERVPVDGGAELITIHARLDGIQNAENNNWVPLVTVLRDTLGDLSPENDRLRYVWPLTYTRPTMRQRLTAAVPFLYSRVGNKNHSPAKAPPPILDLAATDHDVWNKMFWTALQNLLLDPYG